MMGIRRISSLFGAAAILAGGACSFVLDFDECRQTADCQVEGEAPRSCSEGRCVAIDAVTCTSSQACADDFGEAFICGPSARCVSVLTEECQAAHWPSGSRDDVVIMGVIIPTSPPYDAITVPLRNAVELAVEDFNKTVSLPGGRKVGWIECDDGGVITRTEAAAGHLIDGVGVPALLGPIFSEHALKVARDYAIPKDVFLISPTASNKDISGLADKGLVWRTIPSDLYQASALAARIPALGGEPCAVAAQCPGGASCDPDAGCAAPAKVVILKKDDAYGSGLQSDIVGPLTDALPPGGLLTIKYPDPVSFASVDELKSAYGGVIGEAFGAAPDTVIILGTSEASDLVGGYLQALAVLNPTPMPPRFVFTHGAVPVMEKTVLQLEGDSAPLRPVLMGLVEGTSPIIQDPQNFGAYNIRYRIRYDNQDALTTSSLSYDAAMVVMFAMATVGAEQAITGPRIAEGMDRLVDKTGPEISFSADGGELPFIKAAVDVLAAGGGVDLKGVSGDLDFDLTTGEVRTNIIGWDLVPKSGSPDVPVLTPTRIFVLQPAPSTSGVWAPLP